MENEIEALIEDLKSTNPTLVKIAGDTLIKIGPPAIPFLIICLYDNMNYFRRNVGKVLVQFGEPALELLVKEAYRNIKDEFNFLSGNFVIPMTLFGKDAIIPLFELIKYDIRKGNFSTPVQMEGARVFKEMGEPAKNYLLKQLTNSNPYNRSAAVVGLVSFRNKEVISFLINALEDADETVSWFLKYSLCDSEIITNLGDAQNKSSNPKLKKIINDIIEEIKRIEAIDFL